MPEGQHNELREMRSDLLDYMRERFDGIDGRLDHINGTVRGHETRLVVLETQGPAPTPPLMRNPKTYAVGGIGAAIATIALEFLSRFGAGK